MPVQLKELVAKLNDTCRRSLEGAAGLCLSRTNYNVEMEHWFMKLIEPTGTDVDAIFRHFSIDMSRLNADLTRAIDRFRTGNSRPPALSQNVVDAVKEAWLLASVDFNAAKVRSGYLLSAILSSESLGRMLTGASDEFEKISPEALRKELESIIADTDESGETPQAAEEKLKPGEKGKRTGPTKTPNLDQFTINLTERARNGEIDPVLGRDSEVRQIIDILCRRRQNNPILTGEAGVGKTAVAEGFAIRIANGDIPPALENVEIRTLDLGLLQAGAGVKGEFENRLKGVIDEVKGSPTPIILFIDEAHQMIGAGGSAGQGDAANLLKPALARGELRTIAATTWAEYKKYFERDAALARRFQVVKVEEPEEKAAIDMMRGLVATLENHHGVRIRDEAVVDAVKLSHRYISGRLLPDKSVSLLDTTCARIGLSQNATPPGVEDARRRIETLTTALGILEREAETGVDHGDDIAETREELEAGEANLERLNEKWEKERELVTRIQELNAKLLGEEVKEEPAEPPTDAVAEEVQEKAEAAQAAATSEQLTDEQRAEIRTQLQAAEAELAGIQGEEPLVHVCVNSVAVAETVSSWTGIPLGRMVADEVKTVLNMKELLEESVVGQSHAMDQIAQAIRTSRAGLEDPNKPKGVFLLVGTSGTGKTETAITLANLLYGGEQNMTTINMSEFKEEHKVSLLMGSPPGYVGYGEGGVLTEAVRRKPYSVVLLDEMEKAHPGVQDVFYQVFDKGQMKDGEGRDIDFKNSVIIMTSNAATDLVKNLCADEDTRPDPDDFAAALHAELVTTFKPAFLGRCTVIPYYTLTDEVMQMIIKLKLKKVGRRIKEHYKASFSYDDKLVEAIGARCTEVDTGARNVDLILNKTLLPELSAEFLGRMSEGGAIDAVNITVGDDGQFVYEIS